jgi:protein-S-isoprenylcysteine O-methyltransferase Ste14
MLFAASTLQGAKSIMSTPATSRMLVVLRAVLYSSAFVLLWAWLAVSARPLDDRLHLAIPVWIRPLGWVLAFLGALLCIWCISTFVARGKGTPAPFDPPREFVAEGPYRYVRNPMYIGGFGALFGAGLAFLSPAILGVAVLFLLLVYLLVVLYEEPSLGNRFGAPYLQYKSSVHRWLPRLPRSNAMRDAG